MPVAVKRTQVVVAEPGTFAAWIDRMKLTDSDLGMVICCDTHLGYDCASDSSFTQPRHTFFIQQEDVPFDNPALLFEQHFSKVLSAYPIARGVNVRAEYDMAGTVRVQLLYGTMTASPKFAVTVAQKVLKMAA